MVGQGWLSLSFVACGLELNKYEGAEVIFTMYNLGAPAVETTSSAWDQLLLFFQTSGLLAN